MATTDYNFSLQRDEIIRRALGIVGVRPVDGQSLTAEQITNARIALNSVVKAWQNKGVFLWTLQLVSFNTVANDLDYDLEDDPKIINIEGAWYRQSNNDIPLSVKSYAEYLDIETKQTTVGAPQIVAVDYTPSTPTVYVWPNPDAVYSIRLLGIKQLADLDTSTTVPTIPQNYIEALTFSLAESLSFDYRRPIEERQQLYVKQKDLFDTAYQSQRDDSDTCVIEDSYPNEY